MKMAEAGERGQNHYVDADPANGVMCPGVSVVNPGMVPCELKKAPRHHNDSNVSGSAGGDIDSEFEGLNLMLGCDEV